MLQTAHLNLLAAARPGAAPFVTVLIGDPAVQEGALRDLLASLGGGARVMRVGNPLRSPLTIERILIQAAQADIGLLSDDDAVEAMQRLCLRRDGESRVLLVVDQAETLSPGAVRVLSRLVAPGGRVSSRITALLHVVLIGQPSFKQLLRDPVAAPIRDALANQPDLAPLSKAPAASHAAPAAAPAAPPPAPQHPAAQVMTAPVMAVPVMAVPVTEALVTEAPVMAPPPSPAPAWQQGPAAVLPAAALPPVALPPPARFPLLQALLVLLVLCVLGIGAVVGLPYVMALLPHP